MRPFPAPDTTLESQQCLQGTSGHLCPMEGDRRQLRLPALQSTQKPGLRATAQALQQGDSRFLTVLALSPHPIFSVCRVLSQVNSKVP